MSAKTTLFREFLQTTLGAALDPKVKFVGGPLDDPQEQHDLGCIWLEGKVPMPQDGNMEQVTYYVRLFRVWRQSQGPEEPMRNLDKLEEDVETLQAALKSVLAAGQRGVDFATVGHDFFRVDAVAPNYELQCVEAQLTAFQRNEGAAGS